VLITGGAGFIGSHVADAVAAAGHDVRLLDLLLPAAHPAHAGGRPDHLAHPLTVGDIRDPSTMDHALAGVDAVCHQAAMVGLGVDPQDLPQYAGHNDLGTAVVLAGMHRAGVDRLLLASSMVVYGEGRYRCPDHGVVRAGPRTDRDLAAGVFEPRCPDCAAALGCETVPEDTPPDPRNGYAATKLAQENLAAAWARSTGGRATALRYHNVYGPRMPRNTPYAGVASIFRSALERGEPPRVFEDGGQRRDFVHVRDVAAANLAALTADPAPGGLTVYNIGSGMPHTVGEMAAALAAAHGGPTPVVTGQYRLGDVRHITASTDRARAALGFTAGVGFADGMIELAAAPLRG
jgi:dTDP-L-rhamnose 4-epimerase